MHRQSVGPAQPPDSASAVHYLAFHAASRGKKISTTFTVFFSFHFISFLGTRKIQVNLRWTNIIKVCMMRLCGSVKELQF